jgi:hypothetical protein
MQAAEQAKNELQRVFGSSSGGAPALSPADLSRLQGAFHR